MRIAPFRAGETRSRPVKAGRKPARKWAILTFLDLRMRIVTLDFGTVDRFVYHHKT